jgi:hypothetical protein
MKDTKDKVSSELQDILSNIGMDRPTNFDEIVEFCTEDVQATADPVEWHSGDVVIALRRWMESKSPQS